MDYYAGSGFSGKRYTVANLVIPSIGAVATTEVQVTLPGAKVGVHGWQCADDSGAHFGHEYGTIGVLQRIRRADRSRRHVRFRRLLVLRHRAAY